jgi:hypothetical protein
VPETAAFLSDVPSTAGGLRVSCRCVTRYSRAAPLHGCELVVALAFELQEAEAMTEDPSPPPAALERQGADFRPTHRQRRGQAAAHVLVRRWRYVAGGPWFR